MNGSLHLELSGATRVSESDDVLFRAFGDDAVLLNLETEEYYSLNGTGAEIWQMLSQGMTIDETCARISEEFGVPDATVRADILALVADLRAANLVVLHS